MIGDVKVELCRLYENTSSKGNRYLVGYLGKAKVLLLRDEKAAEGQPPWVLFLCERPEKRADVGQTPPSVPKPLRPAVRARRPTSKCAAVHDRPFDDPLDVALFP